MFPKECHEKIREIAWKAAEEVKNGRENDFQARVHADSYFEPIKGDLDKILNDATTLFGRAPQQVEEFIVDYVEPVLAEYAAEDAIEIVDLEL